MIENSYFRLISSCQIVGYQIMKYHNLNTPHLLDILKQILLFYDDPLISFNKYLAIDNELLTCERQ